MCGCGRVSCRPLPHAPPPQIQARLQAVRRRLQADAHFRQGYLQQVARELQQEQALEQQLRKAGKTTQVPRPLAPPLPHAQMYCVDMQSFSCAGEDPAGPSAEDGG